MSYKYRGQWVGDNSLDSTAVANLNIDGETLTGRVSVLEVGIANKNNYAVWFSSTFKGNKKSDSQIEGDVILQSIHYRNGNLIPKKELEKIQKETGLEFPTSIKLKGTMQSDNILEIITKYNYPTVESRNETFKLIKTAKSSSTTPYTHMTWDQFKEFALDQKDGVIYRGQAKSWPLQTSFHRTGFADLNSYLDNQVLQLEHHINSFSNYPYNIQEDRSLGALLNLAQHHGYPTPLLDWTKSPYVAAFFAFANNEELKKEGKVTIFVFDNKKWSALAGNNAPMRAPNMIVRTVELPSFNNPRVLPQQALTMFSNMNDIENIIQFNEKNKGEYLKRITINASEATRAMRDLKLMGLTWAALFPGFDGICKQLKLNHFQ